MCAAHVCSDDVLPCRVYLRHCALAAQRLGPKVYDNFLDCTYLVGCSLLVQIVSMEGCHDGVIGRCMVQPDFFDRCARSLNAQS